MGFPFAKKIVSLPHKKKENYGAIGKMCKHITFSTHSI